MEEAAIRILGEIGIGVNDEFALATIAKAGFKPSGGRFKLDRATIKAFIGEERKRNGNSYVEVPPPYDPGNAPLTVFVAQYPPFVHDPETDKIVPFTRETLVPAVKLLDTLADRGVTSGLPGVLSDVPPVIQTVEGYWIAATHSRHGSQPVDPKNEFAVPYVMDMADALGHPMRHLPVYMFSPLNLTGESLRCVLKYRDRLEGISVSGMPAPGSTAPINVGDALAMSAAEAVGGAIIMRAVLGKPVWWGIDIFPVDLRSMAMIYGSPENFLFHLLFAEVNAYFHGEVWYPAAGNIHTMAKLPGAQACAEKMGIMTAGALLGERQFGAAGTLAMDEVFSAEQLMYDLEIKDHVQRLVSPIDADCDPDRATAVVREGVAANSFAGLDSTQESYKDLYWHPALFERDFLKQWQAGGAVTIRKRARDMIRELGTRHSFRLEEGKQKAIDAILARARADVQKGVK
jgi:trimethylamine:corrinoid methyltransferase-like protein